MVKAKRSVIERVVPPAVRRTWAGVLVGVLGLSLVAAAVLAPGFKTADLRLHDGAVFAVKHDGALLGLVNTQIKDLATAFRMADSGFEIRQEGRSVVVSNPSSNQVQTFDAASGEPGPTVALPDSGELVTNAGQAAVLGRINGAVWFGPTADVLAKDFTKEKALLDLGESARVAITVDGTLLGLSLRDSQLVKRVGDRETRVKVPLALDVTQPNVELSAVGEKAVVLDRTKQLLWFEGADAPMEVVLGSTARLAEPAADTGHMNGNLSAILATATGLVGMGVKEVRSLGATPQGTPGTPVVVGRCIHAVIGSRVVSSCADQQPRVQEIPQLPENAQLQLRTNRDVVILNDSRTGYVWLVDDNMRLITDWDKVTPKTVEQKDPKPEDVRPVDPQRGKNPPIAVDDVLQARAGRSTVLPVLDNDSDPDGDVLVIAADPAPGDGVTYQRVRGGGGLQVTVDPGATGTRTFRYTINDGTGFAASANVTLTLLSGDQASQNTAPVQWRSNAVPVASGKVTSIRALLDWRDPEGDDLVLKNATIEGTDDEVTFTPDGTVTFTDVGKRTGVKTVHVEVFDGHQSTTGTLALDVRRASEVPPLANGDFYTTTVGTEIEVKPLLNDQGVNLTLMNIDSPAPAGPKVTPDYPNGTFRFKADLPGTYYIGYKVSSGPWSYGLVRVEVTERSVSNQPPVAQRDVALLTHSGSVTIDPLINDEDPDGDVMVVQTYTTVPGLQIEMRDRHLMTIKEIVAHDKPVTLTYQVSDGRSVVPGTIVVIPTNPIGEVRPMAVADDVNVRVGDAVSVRPLANDYSPVGLDLSLDTKLLENVGNAWVDGEYVRFVAPSVPGRVTATYEVVDSLGRKASAQVRFNVISADVVNQPPAPTLVTGRVLAGSVSRIQVPLQNIDPNGDTVRLVGLHTGPKLGRVLSVGPRWLEYEAYKDSRGTDSFTYVVTDTSGAKGVGEIRVGVVPASTENTRPTAVDDSITTRPGREVVVAPLVNDFDVDGDKISLVSKESVSFPMPVTVNDDSTISFTMPAEEGRWVGTYTIKDARGQVSSGNVTLVSDAQAPLAAPVTQDDLVDATQVFLREAVDVPVLSNDYDPDGPKKDLVLSVPAYDTGGGPAAEPVDTANGPVIRVPIGDRMRTLRYAVTDADGNTSYGFVLVPGKQDAVPTLKDPTMELSVLAGEPLRISVGQYVQGTQGRKVRLTAADLVSAAPGSARMESASDLIYQAGIDYSGPAAVTFEVTEDLDPGQQGARSATITMRIKVEPRPLSQLPEEERRKRQSLNQAPQASDITIEVGAGEPAVQRNLFELVTDPEGDAFEFGTFEGSTVDGITFSSTGNGQVSVEAAVDAKGRRGSWSAEVVDVNGARGRIVVGVLVTASTRPLTSVVDDEVPDANQGQPSSVNVTANDRSSLTDPTLTLLPTVVVESGSGQARVDGDNVVVTPDENFVGVMRVRYTVMDATGDADRNVDGRVVLTVRGKPGAPGTPREVAVGNGELTATWTAALDNGLPITHYVLTATAPGGVTGTNDRCETTTCTISGLTNGAQYLVKVAAVNSLGAGPESAESAVIMPNTRPEPMEPPVVQRGPGATGNQLVLSWPAAKDLANQGTQITRFHIQMVDGGSGATVTVSAAAQDQGNSYVWTGLVNGTDYSFTIAAENAAGTSDPSGPSSPAHPSAPTSPPRSVVAEDETAATQGGRLRVSWTPPADNNGDQPTHYRIVRGKTPDALREVVQDNVWGTNTTVDATNGDPHYYGVIAVNPAGDSTAGVTAAAVAPYAAPTVPTTPTVKDGDGKVTITGSTASAQGQAIDGWEIRRESTGEVRRQAGATLNYQWVMPNSRTPDRWQVAAVSQKKTGTFSQLSQQARARGVPTVRLVWYHVELPDAGTYRLHWKAAVDNHNGNTDDEVLITVGNTVHNAGALDSVTGLRTQPLTVAYQVSNDLGARSSPQALTSKPMVQAMPVGATHPSTVRVALTHVPTGHLKCRAGAGTNTSPPKEANGAWTEFAFDYVFDLELPGRPNPGDSVPVTCTGGGETFTARATF